MDSTEDSGPMKPGNSVEDKTLTTGNQREERTPWQQPEQLNLGEDPDSRRSPSGGGKSWTRGERDTGRESIQRMDQGPRKPIGGSELRASTEPENRRGYQLSGATTPTIPGHPRRKKVPEEVK